ncbi:hypothetical protein ES703_28425 [subsurface metagenome]
MDNEKLLEGMDFYWRKGMKLNEIVVVLNNNGCDTNLNALWNTITSKGLPLRKPGECYTSEAKYRLCKALLFPKLSQGAWRLLQGFLAGDRIDPITAWTKYGIYNYSGRKTEVVRFLQHRGFYLKKRMKKLTNRFGVDCWVAEFWMETEARLNAQVVLAKDELT